MYSFSGGATGERVHARRRFPEFVPLEDKEGMAMRNHLQDAIESIAVEPPENEYMHAKKLKKEESYVLEAVEPPTRESVLIFPDSLGVCQGIVEYAPAGRIGHLHVVDTPIAELTEDEVKSLINDKQGGWDMVIMGASLDPPESCAVHHIIAMDTIISRLYFWIAKVIAGDDDRANVKRMAVLTRGTFAEESAIHEEAGLGLITNHTVFGMSNSIRMELQLSLQYIDIDWHIEMPWWQAILLVGSC